MRSGFRPSTSGFTPCRLRSVHCLKSLEISLNLLQKVQKKKIRLAVAEKDRLEVFNLADATVNTIVQSWTNPAAAFKKTNASLPSVVLPAGLDRLKFLVPEAPEWGPCRILSTRTQNKSGLITVMEKVVEGGSNNDAPRLIKPHHFFAKCN